MILSVQSHIHSIAYFAGVSDDDLAYITAHSTLHSFATGDIIFMEGDRAKGLWIVESGHIKIFKLNLEGVEHILHLRGPGKSFNDIAALDGGSSPASAGVLSPTAEVWLVPTAVITRIMQTNSQVALNVIHLLAVRVRKLVSQIEDLALYSVVVRLARFLLRQIDDPSLSGPGVTRTAIAAHLNTTPQTVSVALREIEASGAIQFDRHHIRIIREDILTSIAML